MRFGNPSAFYLLWFLPLLWIVAVVLERRGRKRLTAVFGQKLAPFLSRSVSGFRKKIKLFLRLLALACFILAMARPQLGQSMQEVKVQGVEMMIAVDVSISMLAEDVKPSRLDYAKAEINRLLDLLSGDKVGLVAFAGSSVLLSPLTTDKAGLKMFVDSLSPYTVETQGTDVHRALDEARTAFDHGGVDGDDIHKVTRVILVASDGEDQEPGAIEEARKLAGDGTRIFTLAFGTEHGAPIPLRDERGFLRGYKQDKKGQNVLSTVKGDFLKQLAERGKGSFYHASFGGNEAQKIKSDLDKLQKADFASSMATSYDEKFQIPLLLGILLALLELLIPERRREGRIWKGRFEVPEQ
jgi:Ca-activated chloride channel family protein